MSKETERLFIPGYIYLIMPDRSTYVFADKAYEPAKLTIHQWSMPQETLYFDNDKTVTVPFSGYAMYLLQSHPNCYIKADTPEIFSAHRKKIQRWLDSQENQTL